MMTSARSESMKLFDLIFRDQYTFRAFGAGLLAFIMFTLMMVICQ